MYNINILPQSGTEIVASYFRQHLTLNINNIGFNSTGYIPHLVFHYIYETTSRRPLVEVVLYIL